MKPPAFVLVTGASGFLGRALCRDLVNKGFQVRATVRTRPANPIACAETIQLESPAALEQDVLFFQNVECFIHLAGHAHAPGMNASEQEKVFAADLEMTKSLVSRSAEAGVRRFIFVSTSKVLGEASQPGAPFSNDSPPAPSEPYARYKLLAEEAVREQAERHGMEWVVVRPVLVVGEGVKGNLASLLRWMDRGLPLPLGGLRNARSLIALDDLNALLVGCIDSPGAVGRRLLAAGNEVISTTALCRALAEGLDRPARLVTLPAWLWHTLRALPRLSAKAERLAGSFHVDNTQTKALTGWQPQVSIHDALVRAARAFKRGD